MFQLAIKGGRTLGILLMLVAFIGSTFSQERSVASLGNREISLRPRASADSEPADVSNPAAIVARFVDAESRVREALNQHTFKRDVVLQTIGPNGEVTGEYVRNSQFIFDDHGRRIERVLFHPASTIREMRITKEDIQDLASSQLLGIDVAEATKYVLTYAGQATVDSHQVFAIDVRPSTQPDPKHMSERFFVGRIWVDPASLQVVRVRGIVEPHGKQRFPRFETWREQVTGSSLFPTRTEADDVLHFPSRTVHYRIRVRYYDYKRFGSKVNITEIDQPLPD